MTELNGTLKERLEQALPLICAEVTEDQVAFFRGIYEKAGVEPSAAAEEFFRKYGGAFRDSYIVLSDPSRNGAVFFRCYGKYEKDCEDIEYATQFADMAEEAADQSVCPVGFIGYDIPAEVFIGENGLLYCVYEFKEDVDVFTSPAGILAYYLKNNVPVGVEKKQA